MVRVGGTWDSNRGARKNPNPFHKDPRHILHQPKPPIKHYKLKVVELKETTKQNLKLYKCKLKSKNGGFSWIIPNHPQVKAVVSPLQNATPLNSP